MNIKECYLDKKEIIEKALDKAANQIFKAIENDKKYTLSIDENTELTHELMLMHLNN